MACQTRAPSGERRGTAGTGRPAQHTERRRRQREVRVCPTRHSDPAAHSYSTVTAIDATQRLVNPRKIARYGQKLLFLYTLRNLAQKKL